AAVPAGQPQDRAVQEDVLAPGQLGVDARLDLDERSDPAPRLHLAGPWERDPGDQLQRRRLPRAVRADDADGLALVDVERRVGEGPEVLDGLGLLAEPGPLERQSEL